MLKRFFRQGYLAVTDFNFYPLAIEQDLRSTLIFLLLFAATTAIGTTLILAAHLFPAADEFFEWARTGLPPFQVENGFLRVEAEQPYVTSYDTSPRITIIFDTTGTYTTPNSFKEPVVLLTEDQLIYRYEGQTNEVPWTDFPPFSVDPENLRNHRRMFKILYFPLSYSVFLVLSLLFKSLQAVILTPLARFVAITYGVRLSFQKTFTIGVYCLVPATIIDLAVQATGLEMEYFILIYFAIAGIYTYLATQKCSLIDT
jgi:hypothetical protein